MKWYLAKIVYRIVCGDGNHTPQFDEQLRLIEAEDDMHAFQKARIMGDTEEDHFLNNELKPVHWKFIDVAELHPLDNLIDGIELYSKICEEEDAEAYIKSVSKRANYLHGNCLQKTFQMN
ncbi:MAG TPA: DUF4288 domain-containing protein [Hanamia sp.]|nr:DUF4288 domain-containing protein [Hanamia sp.]